MLAKLGLIKNLVLQDDLSGTKLDLQGETTAISRGGYRIYCMVGLIPERIARRAKF